MCTKLSTVRDRQASCIFVEVPWAILMYNQSCNHSSAPALMDLSRLDCMTSNLEDNRVIILNSYFHFSIIPFF